MPPKIKEAHFMTPHSKKYNRNHQAKMNALGAVERYAWFHGGASGAALVSAQLTNDDGSLTVVGEAYLGKKDAS